MVAWQGVLDGVDQRPGQLHSRLGLPALPPLDDLEQLRRVVEARGQEILVYAHQGADHVPAVHVAIALGLRHVVAHDPEPFDDDVRERHQGVDHVLLVDRQAELCAKVGIGGVGNGTRIVHDHVADDRVHYPHPHGGAYAAPARLQAAGHHDVHDHLRRLADAAGRLDLQELRVGQHLRAVLHDVALRKARAGQQRG